MNKQHKEMLRKLQSIIDELSLLSEQDEEFNNLMWELNAKQNLNFFGCSLDEYNIHDFIEEHENQNKEGKLT
ncbi:hypothetical protein [Niallia sp. MER 6]|uniref:hypothetical protein n=1 Tax=Niallia sp. MER 6 TaxID=2939567 RepID=UPI00203E921A|nr:hypothetical protein [Niallia sp. MER 6]MCM3032890.1 hypothetical protein [Niallia sp. MER 6]